MRRLQVTLLAGMLLAACVVGWAADEVQEVCPGDLPWEVTGFRTFDSIIGTGGTESGLTMTASEGYKLLVADLKAVLPAGPPHRRCDMDLDAFWLLGRGLYDAVAVQTQDNLGWTFPLTSGSGGRSFSQAVQRHIGTSTEVKVVTASLAFSVPKDLEITPKLRVCVIRSIPMAQAEDKPADPKPAEPTEPPK